MYWCINDFLPEVARSAYSSSKEPTLFTSENGERCVFVREGSIFCHGVYFIMYLLLDMEINSLLFIYNLALWQ